MAGTSVSDNVIKVLLIEDNPGDVSLIQSYLADSPHAEFQLDHADRLLSGLNRMDEAKPDVLLLDLGLPDCAGLASYHNAHNYHPDVPIVVLTGLDDDGTALKAVQEGAEDYLVKDRIDAEQLIRAIQYAIKRNERRRLSRATDLAQRELHVAWRVQYGVYPDTSPDMSGLHIDGVCYPTASVSGDYYDYIPMLDDHLGIVIGDAGSHGMGSALLSAQTRATLRALSQTYKNVDEIVTKTNRILAESLLDNHFITLMFIRFDPRTRSMIYVSAGHPAGYVYDGAGDIVRTLDSTDPPIGITPDCDYNSSASMTLEPGQLLLLFTDGVLDAGLPDRRPFGLERINTIVREHRNVPGADVVDALSKAILAHCQPDRPHDDMTVIAITAEPESSVERPASNV